VRNGTRGGVDARSSRASAGDFYETGGPPPPVPSPGMFRPAGDEPLESGAGTLRAACPTLGRQERRITGGADDPHRRLSAECSRLDHHRRRRRCRHHATPFAARTTCRATCRLVHRSPTGRLAGLGLRGRTGRCASPTGRAKLHERRTAAVVRATKTTAATRGGREATEGDHEAQGTAHDWHLHHRRAGYDPRSDTMRRPRRRLRNPSSRSVARSETGDRFSKKFSCRLQPATTTLPMGPDRSDCASSPFPPPCDRS
jgi:hypothetical protein